MMDSEATAQVLDDPFADDGFDIDLGGFEPKPVEPARAKSNVSVAEAAVEETNFTKEPTKKRATKKKSGFIRSDRFRTGRNELLSIKVTAEDKTRFTEMAQGRWVNGQALSYALDALEELMDDPDHEFWKTRLLHGAD